MWSPRQVKPSLIQMSAAPFQIPHDSCCVPRGRQPEKLCPEACTSICSKCSLRSFLMDILAFKRREVVSLGAAWLRPFLGCSCAWLLSLVPAHSHPGRPADPASCRVALRPAAEPKASQGMRVVTKSVSAAAHAQCCGYSVLQAPVRPSGLCLSWTSPEQP